MTFKEQYSVHNNIRLKVWIPLFFLVIASILPGPLCAQELQYTLRFLVKSDASGSFISGANVQLKDLKKKLKRGDITNRNGLVEFNDVEPDKYWLVISFVGYKTYQKVVNIKDNKIFHVSLEEKVSKLEDVTVSGNREVTTGEVGLTKISRRDLSHIPTPSANGNLASYLQTEPSVIATGDRGGELYISGGIPSQNKTLVDGLPVIKPFHISSFYSPFSEENIRNVDLYTGGYGAEYSGANSAVIDVHLRAGNFKKFSASGSVSPYLTSLKLEGPIKKGRTSFILTGRKSVIEGISKSVYADEKPINFSDLTGRFSFHGQSVTCNATGIYTYDRGRINPARRVGLSWRNFVVGARCLDFEKDFSHPLSVTAGYSYYQNKEASPRRQDRNSSVSQYFLKFNKHARLFNLPINYGLKFYTRTYDAKISELFTDVEAYHQSEGLANLYATTVWTPSTSFSLKPGLTTMVTLNHPPTFEPRLRVAYNPNGNKNIEFNFAAGRYYQTKTAISDFRNAGNIFKAWNKVQYNEPLESAVHFLAGYKQHFGTRFTVKVDGFIKHYDNITISKLNLAAKLNTSTTLAEGKAYGSDVLVTYDHRKLFLSLGYGYSHVKFKAANTDLGEIFDVPIPEYAPPFDQRHKVNATGSYKFFAITANVNWAFGSGQPYSGVLGFDLVPRIPEQSVINVPGTAQTLVTNPYAKRLPTYHRLDISFQRSYDLSASTVLNFKVGAINIYDRKNVFYFNSNTLQRVNQTSILPYLSVKADIR